MVYKYKNSKYILNVFVIISFIIYYLKFNCIYNYEAITMLICASGIVQSINMVKLMTSAEAVDAMKKAGELSYQPPGS